MKKILVASLAGLALSAAASNAFAQVGTTDTYCGTPIISGPNDLDADAPFIGGIKVTSSTNRNVQQVIAKFGAHTLEFTYSDAPDLRRVASAVSAYFQNNHSARAVCVNGNAAELSQWGTPVVVLPLAVLR